ncbi:hypothetical protein [Nocardia sp. NPDC049707]|uniref:hypothetical protein n=1 Tax=Nocardia sp. NPDC049707 TaxID=3154735 RepID=UPI00341FC60F
MSECDCGPWVKLSMCGIGSFNGKTGELESVQRPSRFCMTMAPLVDGKIGDHYGITDMLSPLPCLWIGVRVVNDVDDFMPDGSTPVPPMQEQRP